MNFLDVETPQGILQDVPVMFEGDRIRYAQLGDLRLSRHNLIEWIGSTQVSQLEEITESLVA